MSDVPITNPYRTSAPSRAAGFDEGVAAALAALSSPPAIEAAADTLAKLDWDEPDLTDEQAAARLLAAVAVVLAGRQEGTTGSPPASPHGRDAASKGSPPTEGTTR